MQFTLRNFVLASAAMAAFATTAAMAVTTIKVPFNFTVDGKTCPAGEYSVGRENNGNVVTLRSAKQSFSWTLGPGDPSPADTRVVLKFDNVGLEHRLSRIQYEHAITGKLDKNDKQSEQPNVRVISGQ